jgi:amino acid adenylation domain-containing protein
MLKEAKNSARFRGGAQASSAAPGIEGRGGVENILDGGRRLPPKGKGAPTAPSSPLGQMAPLSYAQERLWFLEQLNPATPLLSLPRALRLRGRLDRWALEQALGAVLERHQVLRTRFNHREGEPWQEVRGAPILALPLCDLSPLSVAERERQLQARLEQEARSPFDLAGEVLLRARLYRLAPQEHVLFVNLHQLAADAGSYQLLFEEVSRRYGAIVTGVPAPLPELPMQYADLARWEHQGVGRAALEPHLAYWKQQLTGAPDELELPTDRPRPGVVSIRGGRRALPLGEERTARLRQLSGGENVTLLRLLQTAFHLLLHRLTSQLDLLVGVPVSGRGRVETERLIGPFAKTLAIRSQLSGNPTFREFLRETCRTTRDALAHQEVPLETLVALLRSERAARHPPPLQVMFAFQGAELNGLALPGLSAIPLEVHTGTTQFELTLTIRESPRHLVAELEYCSALFDAPTIDRWLRYYATLLAGLGAGLEQRVWDLPLLEAEQRQRLLVEWNHTRTDFPRDRPVPALFEEQAQARSEAVAVEFGQQQLSYRELNLRANQLAHYLKRAGVKPGTLVGVCLERSLELIVSLLGILKAGGAYAALDLASPKERLRQILQDLQAPVLLAHSALLDRLPRLQPTGRPAPLLLCLDTQAEAISRESGENLEIEVEPEALAYVSYTSGSTGRPKGVCVPHRAVVRLVKGTAYAGFGPIEVFLHLSPVAFDASTFELWGCLLNGGRLVVAPPELPSLSDLADTIREHRVTTAWFTSGLFNQLVDLNLEGLRPLRQILTGGDVLSPPHIRAALEGLDQCQIINGYGPTENTTFSATYTIPRDFDGQHSVPIGRPIANSHCYVLDEQLQLVPIGIPGELYVGGDGLALGYLNQPQLTAERFIENPFQPGERLYKTGDRVRYLVDGNLEFLGRLDQQVKVRGFRVELGEIEAALLEHPAIGQCAVTTRPDAAGTRQLVAYLVARLQPAPTMSELREFLQRKLPDYMVPAFLVFLEALPLSPNGKVDRRGLPAPEVRESVAQQSRAPRDELEQRLQQLWEDLLPVRPIGRHDQFFACGGHSLLALRLLARMEKTFGKKLTVATLLQNPTIAQLAVVLRGRQAPDVDWSIVEVQGKGSRPPLMLVHGPGGGMLWGYSNLACHLGPDQPVFAFRSRGLDGVEEWESIEAMAEAYLVDLHVFQPQGPYYLGGFGFGGVVAYQMACRLQALGEPVAFLGLLAASPPNASYARWRWRPGSVCRFLNNFRLRMASAVRHHPDALWSFLSWKTQRLVRRRLTRAAAGAERHVSFDEFVDLAAYPEDQRRIWESHVRALNNYHPPQYAGRLVLLRTPLHPLLCSFDPCYGWGEFCRGDIAVQVIRGTPETMMEEPRVQELAAALRRFLNEAQAGLTS